LDLGNIHTNGDSNANGTSGDGQRGVVANTASPLVALQLYAAVLDDIRAKALPIVEWAEASMAEFEAATSWGKGKGGTDAAE